MAEKIETDSITGGKKGVKPTRFDLLPVRPLEAIAQVYNYGAKKYADNNWRQGYLWSWSFAALMRHLWAFWGGEDKDPESGLPHLSHAGFHVLALLEFSLTHPEKDDRWKESNERS